MVRLDILTRLIIAGVELTSHRSNPHKKIFVNKIFSVLKKINHFIFRYKKNENINEFSSSFGKYKTRRIS